MSRILALSWMLLTSCTCGQEPQLLGFYGGAEPLGGGGYSAPPPGEPDDPPPGGIDMNEPWVMRVVHPGANGAGQADGADGVHSGDSDGDGRLDLVTGHEQGLRATVSYNPGPVGGLVRQPWPTVTLPATGGNLCSVEDAVLADVDRDGALDVVAACELGAVRVTVIYAPSPPNTRSELLNAANWTRVDIAASANNRSMRVEVVDLAGDDALELVVGGKESSGPDVAADVGYYSSATPRDGGSWTFTELAPAGWVMQMYVVDLDADSDLDVVYSDRDPINVPALDNSRRGVRWLRNDGADPPGFTEHQISAVEGVHKWFTLYDWDEDGDLDVHDCRSDDSTNTSQVLLNGGSGLSWSSLPIPQPTSVGQCQHFTVQDVDQDGAPDFAYSYSNAQGVSAVAWQRVTGDRLSPVLERGEISGVLSTEADVKMDNLEWRDVDGDGDPDAVLTEQHVDLPEEPKLGNGPGIGYLYFENPLIAFDPPPAPPEVTCSVLTSGSTSTDGSSAQTASVSPIADRVVYVAVLSSNASGPVTATFSGNGLTWGLVASTSFAASNARRITVREAIGTSPTAGAITLDFAGQTQTSFAWAVVQCTGVTRQVVTNSSLAVSVTTINATLGALASPESRALVFAGHNANNSIAPDPDYVELVDVTVANGNATLEVETAVNQTTCDPTHNSAAAGIVAVEVGLPP